MGKKKPSIFAKFASAAGQVADVYKGVSKAIVHVALTGVEHIPGVGDKIAAIEKKIDAKIGGKDYMSGYDSVMQHVSDKIGLSAVNAKVNALMLSKPVVHTQEQIDTHFGGDAKLAEESKLTPELLAYMEVMPAEELHAL